MVLDRLDSVSLAVQNTRRHVEGNLLFDVLNKAAALTSVSEAWAFSAVVTRRKRCSNSCLTKSLPTFSHPTQQYLPPRDTIVQN